MERLESLVLEAWKEVGRQQGVQAVLDALGDRLVRELAGAALRIRAFDVGRSALDTVGALGRDPGAARDVLEPHERQALLDWSSEGATAHGRARDLRRRFGPVVGERERGELRLAPLLDESRLVGIAILTGPGGRPPSPAVVQRFGALCEPIAAALASERRIHEIGALREAAEADRRSLLTRLGRRDIGETIVGAEGGLASVMERVALVADSDIPVLLLGETGSGKEVVARTLRNRSRRASGPFVRVNCGAIPAGLIDSELFGHERGSFSGATAQRQGWFERADGGTLFLDEVGELPLEAQVRLLRVLQDGTFERVGGQSPVHVDVRVIAATHRDLRLMVREGRFREDLWYRLAVFPIEIPPLRDRPEDVPALATHFALRACERFGTRPLAPTASDLDLLARYDWPGNVRELAAVLDRAVILGGGARLDVATALGRIDGAEADGAIRRGRTTARSTADAGDRPFPTLDHAMALHIESALERCQGRIEGPTGAAALLDINPHTLRARMRKLGVDWQRFRERKGLRDSSRA
ncbi:MAG: sigma-54 dependent transcriptional regulator [Myxococcota bacterium]